MRQHRNTTPGRIGLVALGLGCLITVSTWAAFSVSAQPQDARWDWPTGGPVAVTRPFDPPPEPWLAGHRGVDLRLGLGEPVLAPIDGTVIYAGVLVDRGVVSIEHGNYRSSVEPVTPAVSVGQQVVPGQVIGYLEQTSAHDGLHWGVRLDDVYVDPLSLIVGPIVLKPTPD